MQSPYLTGREKWDRLERELCDLGDYRGMWWGGRKGGKQIVFAGKKRLLHRLIISYKLEETNIYCF